MSTNLILIDSNLNDTNILFNALNDETFGIIYDYDTSRNTILQQIDTAFSVKAIERVAICCHEGVNQFLVNGNFFDLDESTNEVIKNPNTQFIFDLLKTYNVSNIDYLACSSLKYESWRKFCDLIENEVEGVTVGASEDETGNLKYGGNWVMENTGDIIDIIYFSERIEYYKYLLTSTFSIIDPPATNRYVSHEYNNEYGITYSGLIKGATNLSWATFKGSDIEFINNGLESFNTANIQSIFYDGSRANPYPYSVSRDPPHNDPGFFLEMTFENSFVSGIVIERRGWEGTGGRTLDGHKQLITSYRVRAFINGSWNIVIPDAPYTQTIDRFIGSTSTDNHYLEKVSKFETPIVTTKVRIYPTSGVGFLSGHFGIEISVPTTIDLQFDISSVVTYENYSTNTITLTLTTSGLSNEDISNSLTLDPSNCGQIIDVSGSGYMRTISFEPTININEPDCSLIFHYNNMSMTIPFSVDTLQPPTAINLQFDISSVVTYENYSTNTITLTLATATSGLSNVDISNSLTIDPSNCGQIVDVSGTGVTRTISFEPTLYINEPDCSLIFYYNYSLMTIPFSVDTEQKIEDISMNPKSIFNSSATLGVKFRLPVESSGTPDITISPSYIARIDNVSAISGGSDTWTGTITKTDNMNLLHNVIDFSYNGLDTSLNFNVAQNPELIVGPREIGEFVECKGIKITSVSLTEEFTVSEVQIFYESSVLVSTGLFSNSSNSDSAFIMNGNLSDTTILNNSGEKWFKILFATNIKIKEITLYASHSVKVELLGIQITPDVDNTITNLGQVNVDVSGTINIANASTQSTITRAVTDITLDLSNIVYPDVSSNFEMLFSTNTVSLSDISNNYISFDPSNAAILTNLSLTENNFKLVGKIKANKKIFEEDCKLKYYETIDDISGEKHLAIKDLFITSSSIVPKTIGVSSINFEHNVGILELVFTLDKPDLSLNDFALDNSASITNLTKNGLIWNADITFPRTDSDVSVNYNIGVNYKSGYSYPINTTYNTFVPVVGDEIPILDIYNEVPNPSGENLDISLNGNTILTSGTLSEKREKRDVFIERLLDTYKETLKDTNEKLVMKTEELLGTESGITKEKIKIIDNFDASGNKLTEISFNTLDLSGDEALYVPLDVSGSITFNTYSSKLKVKRISDTSFNVYENYDDSNPIFTNVMTFDETSIYDFFKYKIGTVEGENLPVITNITLNPSNIISDLSSNLQVTFSQTASQQPIITIDPSYIAYLDGSMTSNDGYTWSGTIKRTLEMNRLNNTLTVSGEYHSSSISFDVLENNNLVEKYLEKLGDDIDGEAGGDQSGHSVSLSSDGTIVAIGAIGSNSGHVRVYQWNDSSWNQIGPDIDGYGQKSGYSVSLSSDGTIVAIGSPYYKGNDYRSGLVRVFQWNDSSWNQIGPDIDGEAGDDWTGYSVSLSSDGTIVAIGAPGYYGNGSDSGNVRVFHWNDSSWNQMGNDIDGEAAYDQGGNSVSLSSDGTIVAIGGQYNDGNGGNNAGHVRVFQWNDSSWNQMGVDIDGEAVGDRSGRSVSLSSDGTTVAIGAPHSGNGSGHVRVFQWNDSSWNQIGPDINGEYIEDRSGYSVSLSSDGTIVAIGARFNDGNGSNSGHVRVFQYNNTSWIKLGPDINGEYIEDRSGYSVSLSSDGTTVAIGAPYNDGFKGHVRVYEYKSIIKRQLTSTTLAPSDIIYPEVSSNFEILFTTNDKTLNDISGNLELEPSDAGYLTNLQLAHSGFKLVGNIEAPTLKRNQNTQLKYFETVDISGESNPFDIYTYPPFQLVNFALTPENIVGPNDVSSNLQIEFNIPIPTDVSLNNFITIDPSYIVNLEDMTTNDNGYTWSGAINRELYMNKLGNKLDFSYTYNDLGLNDENLTASGELVFDVLENKNVLKWEKKTDTSLNEVFDETVEISPNGQILAQISGSNAKIYHLSGSTWSLEKEISGNHLSLCDQRIAIATDVSLQVYEYNGSWSQIGSNISSTNISNLAISNDGNRVAYVYDVSSVGIQEYSEGIWSLMTITGTITGNSVKFSPNGLLLGVGTLDSENQNFSNVVLYEYSEDSSAWNLKP